MKNKLTIMMIALTCLLGACKKDGDGINGGGAAITDEAGAKGLFSKINSLYTGTLRPALSKSVQTFNNTVLTGSSGTATVNGQYSATRASSSSSSTSTSTVDVVIVFKDFEKDGLRLNGTVRFFDYSNSRTACSSSGCASSNHSSFHYDSSDGSGTSFGPANIQFEYNGKSYKDAVSVDMSKSDNFHWSIKVTNKAGQVISTSY